MELYGIVGAGGHGRDVMPILEGMVHDTLPKNDYKLVYIVENNKGKKNVNGIDVVTPDEFLSLKCTNKYFNIAIADSYVRERISIKLCTAGVVPFTIKHPNVVVYESSSIHDSAILSPFTCITANVSIGRFFHANLYSYVEHDCVIGDFVTFAPGVKCNGNVVIEDHAYIGAGAVIKQGTHDAPLVIGTGAVVGMGAVVTKSVASNTVVFGNPAKLAKVTKK